MSERRELIALYTNRQIINGNEGVTFMCDEIVIMRINKEIIIDRLK